MSGRFFRYVTASIAFAWVVAGCGGDSSGPSGPSGPPIVVSINGATQPTGRAGCDLDLLYAPDPHQVVDEITQLMGSNCGIMREVFSHTVQALQDHGIDAPRHDAG